MPFDPYPITPARIDSKASRAIEAAMGRIDRPEKWCKRAHLSFDRGILQRCGLNAVISVSHEGVAARRPALVAMHQAAQARGFMSFASFNDAPNVTHADVLACMREAVELAKVAA